MSALETSKVSGVAERAFRHYCRCRRGIVFVPRSAVLMESICGRVGMMEQEQGVIKVPVRKAAAQGETRAPAQRVTGRMPELCAAADWTLKGPPLAVGGDRAVRSSARSGS